MKTLFKLCYLDSSFYKDYPIEKYCEFEYKEGRPYLVLLIKINNNDFAIPFRINIKHNYCYKFKHSNRFPFTVTGLDFSKAIIITKKSYIGNNAKIDSSEYYELNSKIHFIIIKFKRYIDKFIKIMNNQKINIYEYNMMKLSTLCYFKEYLEVSKDIEIVA